jgi:hypothetical protein
LQQVCSIAEVKGSNPASFHQTNSLSTIILILAGWCIIIKFTPTPIFRAKMLI